MSAAKPMGSLSPRLLARKGGARPAMRPQMPPLAQFLQASTAELDDLGWNDMGGDEGEAPAPPSPFQFAQTACELPLIPRALVSFQPRRVAVSLKLDEDRRLRLKLGAILCGRSAQQLLTEALDRVLDSYPELAGISHGRRPD